MRVGRTAVSSTGSAECTYTEWVVNRVSIHYNVPLEHTQSDNTQSAIKHMVHTHRPQAPLVFLHWDEASLLLVPP
jgi:hypothetical protein